MSRKAAVSHKSPLGERRATVPVGDRGRVVLPARIRRSLGVHAGDQLVAEIEPDGSLRLTPRQVLANRDRGVFAALRGETSLVDELLADRRAEVAQKDD